MKIIDVSKKNIHDYRKEIFNVWKRGGMVVVPSDTVYGLAVDATSEKAVKKLLSFKSRPPGKAISVFCGSIESALKYVKVSASQKKIIDHLLPGPYTLILPSLHTVSRFIEAEDGSLGIRVPDYDDINNLVHAYGLPVTATSANITGTSPHYSIGALLNTLSQTKKDMIDIILDAGKLPLHKPSTVVDLTADNIKVLRQGDITSRFQFNGETASYISENEHDTQNIATDFIKNNHHAALNKPLIILLIGNLGAGKTVFSKAIADYFGIKRVVSPTFVIYYDYPIENSTLEKFIHVDLYRIDNAEEFSSLGIEDYLIPGNVVCIEWAEKSGPLFQKLKEKGNCAQILIDYTGKTKRKITITTYYENIGN